MTIHGLLHLLLAEPSLLPPAPHWEGARPDLVEARLDEVHTCLGCGAVAGCAAVVQTHLGPRWLDLCAPCFEAMVAYLNGL